jgi:hypothetical protein
MRQIMDLDDLWRDAVRLATTKLEIYKRDTAQQLAAPLASTDCPYSFDDLCAPECDVRALPEKLTTTTQS